MSGTLRADVSALTDCAANVLALVDAMGHRAMLEAGGGDLGDHHLERIVDDFVRRTRFRRMLLQFDMRDFAGWLDSCAREYAEADRELADLAARALTEGG